jgi:hypothetical protein
MVAVTRMVLRPIQVTERDELSDLCPTVTAVLAVPAPD